MLIYATPTKITWPPKQTNLKNGMKIEKLLVSERKNINRHLRGHQRVMGMDLIRVYSINV